MKLEVIKKDKKIRINNKSYELNVVAVKGDTFDNLLLNIKLAALLQGLSYEQAVEELKKNREVVEEMLSQLWNSIAPINSILIGLLIPQFRTYKAMTKKVVAGVTEYNILFIIYTYLLIYINIYILYYLLLLSYKLTLKDKKWN